MIRVIPCLDVDRGRVVKGVNFVDIRDAGDPVELAARYDAEGADELVFLDITATHEERDTIIHLVERTAEEVFIPFTIGGGLRTEEDIRAVLAAGADKVSLNSAAVRDPDLVERVKEIVGWPATEADYRRAGHLIPDDLTRSLLAVGTTAQCRDAVAAYIDAGVTCPILYPRRGNNKEGIDTVADGFYKEPHIQDCL